MKSWFEVMVRARLGPPEKDDKQVVLLGRVVRWMRGEVEWEAWNEVKGGASPLYRFEAARKEERTNLRTQAKDFRGDRNQGRTRETDQLFGLVRHEFLERIHTVMLLSVG